MMVGNAMFERVVAALTKPLERAMAAGDIRKLDPQAVAHMILGNIQGLQVHMILAADEKSPDKGPAVLPPKEAATFLTTMLLDGLEDRLKN